MKVIEGEIQNLEVQRKWVQYIEDCGMIEALPCDKKNQQNYLEQIKRIKRIHEDDVSPTSNLRRFLIWGNLRK